MARSTRLVILIYMARSTRLVILIRYIYFMGSETLSSAVTYFPTNLVYPVYFMGSETLPSTCTFSSVPIDCLPLYGVGNASFCLLNFATNLVYPFTLRISDESSIPFYSTTGIKIVDIFMSTHITYEISGTYWTNFY